MWIKRKWSTLKQNIKIIDKSKPKKENIRCEIEYERK